MQHIETPFVLSGGGARGFAHLGVIKALNEFGIYASAYSATSAGAIAATLLSNGYTTDEALKLFDGNMSYKLLAWNSFKLGLISMDKIREFIGKQLRFQTFEDLPGPLHITATDFTNGRQHIFSNGNLLDPLCASCSIPAVFPPVFINGIPYVDGGLSNNLPVEPFIQSNHKVVAIYVNPVKKFDPDESVIGVLDRLAHLSFREMVGRSAKDVALYIEPDTIQDYSMFDVHKAHELFQKGYDYTRDYLDHTDLSSFFQT